MTCLIPPDRDMSMSAIRKRYDKANVKAICVSDRDVFESLQDIFFLLDYIAKNVKHQSLIEKEEG